MNPCRNIYLIGMMGAGKSTIGRHLAQNLGRRFIDSDQEIEARTGVRIPVIFEIEGEVGFRSRESRMIEELSAAADLVLATGGGAILDPRNRQTLHRSGLVVYLKASPEDLYARTRHDRNRPLLQVADPLARIRELHEARDALYRETAHLIFEGQGGNPQGVARQLEEEIRKTCKP